VSKLCSRCKQLKSEDKFYKVSSSNKLRPECKTCSNSYCSNSSPAAKAAKRRYKSRNPHMVKYHSSVRRARERSQLCTCCSSADRQEVYKNAPDGYHVDHIKPLSKGGPHCCKNFQYLTAKDNLKKWSK
jgi:hypothetical protein